MQRRDFTKLSLVSTIGIFFPFYACKNFGDSSDLNSLDANSFELLSLELLTTWCEAMVATQINDPENTELHGALYCNACNKIHGRCIDAVYPFLFMADTTGDEKYLNAAIQVMEWSKNVSKPDGSWTVIPNPESWPGITVFGAIALGEALQHHGHLLAEDIRLQWTDRLKKAAEFVHLNFTIEYSHINYSMTAVYALNLLGRLFNNERYLQHSKKLVSELPNWLTKPNKFIFGENNPSDEPSVKGLYPVDLGYNVEETLNSLVQYAVTEKDDDLLDLLQESMESHLEFMLPDGAWDNSWGTRQNKWSYWGSRTTDGCQPAFALMAGRKKAFMTAAFKNTELLKRCTVDGLLAGGLHYKSHGVLPCLHHTFTHAKSLAFILDNTHILPNISTYIPLPRSKVYGIKYFSDLAVYLVSKGPWRATISANDVMFKKPLSQTATGGSLALLWHEDIGPLFTASMAEYLLVEPNNQQPQPDGEDIPLTPRVEIIEGNTWFTNLYDLKAEVEAYENNDRIAIDVNTRLTNKDQGIHGQTNFHLNYKFDRRKVVITVQNTELDLPKEQFALVLPLISPKHEVVRQISEQSIEIVKKDKVVILTANTPISIIKTKKDRIFNMVPGMEAVPIKMTNVPPSHKIECIITIS